MSLSAFAFAVLLLLLTPGPTNTLLAVSGATRGLKASLPLIGAECAGYLTAIVPLVFFAAPLLIDQPAAALGIKLASTLWVLLLAARLWIRPFGQCAGRNDGGCRLRHHGAQPQGPDHRACPHSRRRNGLAGSTAPAAPLSRRVSLLVVIVATCWLSAGAAILRRLATTNPLLFGRVAASCLAVFALSLAGRAIGWI
ncbi:hypothetical protein [Agrobacterium sp. MA01]|uniref:hypothetical protein n=1 Tax=Agrobacterium sp. MA01 TaxID=2664893 RepID=UPI001FF03DBC|nr:hypothetical protein [Agrobacterium sp. MA01]